MISVTEGCQDPNQSKINQPDSSKSSPDLRIFHRHNAHRLASISTQLRRIRSPNGVFQPRYDGRKVDEDVLTSVMSFFMLFMVTLAVVATLLGLTGLDFITSLSAASAALANIGPGLGDQIDPVQTFARPRLRPLTAHSADDVALRVAFIRLCNPWVH